MNYTLQLIASAMILSLTSGCFSMWAHRNWQEAKSQQAVRIEADGSSVMVGVDLTAMSYLADNWPVALGAAVLDAGVIYGVYLAVDEIANNTGSKESGGSGDSGRDSVTVRISGDGNQVQVTGDDTVTGAGGLSTR